MFTNKNVYKQKWFQIEQKVYLFILLAFLSTFQCKTHTKVERSRAYG